MPGRGKGADLYSALPQEENFWRLVSLMEEVGSSAKLVRHSLTRQLADGYPGNGFKEWGVSHGGLEV
jgi:hypothetical protein